MNPEIQKINEDLSKKTNENLPKKPSDIKWPVTETSKKLQNTLKTVNNETKKIWSETKQYLNKDKILGKVEVKSIDSIKATKNFAWEREYQNFLNIFKIDRNNPDDFLNKVKEIQKQNSLKEDWVIWTQTLKIIYEKYYSKIDRKNLPFEVNSRLDFDKFMKWYDKLRQPNNSANPRNLPISWDKSAFDKKYFYWEINWENIPWTAFNKELYEKVWKLKLDPKYNEWNSIQVDKTPDWKYFLALFSEWKLAVLSYTSPWTAKHKTPDFVEWAPVWKKYTYKISGSYPTRETKETSGGAVMPMAYHISWDVYIHVWNVTWAWASHGCIRLPGFYQQALAKNLDKNPRWYKIKTWKLYN